jgi:4-amino-4-deoxy-L-arabinose transferase-like glycosyltransferase
MAMTQKIFSSSQLGIFVQFLDRNARHYLTILFSLILVTGVAYSYFLGATLRFPDEKDYYSLATNLVTRHLYSFDGLKPTAFRPPGYPFLLAASMAVSTKMLVLRMVNFLALALTALVLYSLMKRYTSRLAGLISATLIFFYPVLFYSAGTLYPQTIGGLLFLLVIFLIAPQEAGPGPYAAGGLIFGVLILMVPVFLLNVPIIALTPWLRKQKRKVITAVIFFVVAFCGVGLWTVRNYLVLHHFVLLDSHSGITFYYGNSEEATPTSYRNPEKYQAETERLDEVSRDRFYRAKAFEWIFNNKLAAIRLYVLKVINYFNFRVDLQTKSESSAGKDLLMLITYGTLLLLMVARLVWYHKFPLTPFEKYLVIFYISNAFLMAVFLIRIRLRLPYDLLLLGIVGSFIAQFLSFWTHQFQGRKSRSQLPEKVIQDNVE